MRITVVAITLCLLTASLYALEPERPVAVPRGPGECAACHPAARVQWRQGVHAGEGMVCADCHGGDATAPEAAAGHLAMRRFDRPEDVLAVCGGCHAEASSMLPYNLAIDQLVLYRQSAHGRARDEGDERAPLCVDCHLNHRVLAASDPASPAFAGNLPRTCGRCHADAELTHERGLDAGVVEGFARSPHGRALETPGLEAGPSCATCHDGHGAAVPLATQVDETCGACHEETRASLRAGSHQKLLRRQDLAGCASCHPVHGGLRARAPSAICVDCHDPDSVQVAVGSDLEGLLRAAKEEVGRAELALFEAQRVPLDVRDHEALIDDAREYLRHAGSRLHTFERQPIEELTRASGSIAFRVREEIEYRLEHRSARTMLFITWFYAAITLAVLGRFRWRALHRSSR